MQINWKHLATTPGYKSLKAAYIKDVQDAENYRRKFNRKPLREKEEFLRLFNWVINRAKHYAYKHNVPIENILNKWEANRDYWWLNFYSSSRQPKIHSNAKKPEGLKGIKKYYKKNALCYRECDKESYIKELSLSFIMQQQSINSTKEKP